MYSFPVLSMFVLPSENLNIFNSVTSNSPSCLFFLSVPNHTSQEIILAAILLSQITPDTSLHPLHLSALSPSPLLLSLRCFGVNSRYLNSSAWIISTPCSVAVTLTYLSFTHMYCALLPLAFIPLLSSIYYHFSLLLPAAPYFQY